MTILNNMDENISPFDNNCIWYYIIVGFILLVIGWIFILIGCFNKHVPNKCTDINNPDIHTCEQCIDRCDQEWPLNLTTWGLGLQNIIIYLLWTGTVLLLFWGFFHATCRDMVTDDMKQLHRSSFLIILLLNVMDFALFFLFHNIMGSLVANIIALSLSIGMCVMFSTIKDDDSWYIFPMILWSSYRIYSLLYILDMNKGHFDIRNTGFIL